MHYSLQHKAIDNLIVMLLVFSTGGLLFVFNRNMMYGVFIGLLLVTLLFFGKALKKNILNASLLSLFFVSTLFVINYFLGVSEQSINKYAYYLMVILVSILTLTHFLNNRSKEVFIRRLHFILKMIMFHAILSFFAYFFFKNNLTPILASNDYECETFNYLFFYPIGVDEQWSVVNIFGFEFHRNLGLFWEAGVLSGFMNMFLFLEAFIIKKSKGLLFLITITILSTYSTTGLATLLIIGGYYFWKQMRVNKLLILLVFALLVPVYTIFTINLQDKLYGEGEWSFQKRLFDLVQPFYIALNNPLSGIGLDLYQFQKYRYDFSLSSSTMSSLQEKTGIELKVSGSDQGSSNSVMFLVAAMGFPTALLMLYMFFKQQIIRKEKGLWILIMMLTVMSVPLLLRPYFMLFIMSGFAHIFNKITAHKNIIE